MQNQWKIISVQVVERVRTELMTWFPAWRESYLSFHAFILKFQKRSPVLQNYCSPSDQTWSCQQHSTDAFVLTKHWNSILYLLICISMELFAAGKRWKPASISEL